MSLGGVFTLISNVGSQDKLLNATEKLLDTIKKNSFNKLKELRNLFPGMSDRDLLKKDTAWMPELQSLEESHVVFVNSTFKPYIAIAHEYSKTVPRGGKAALGSTFSFTFPIIGEFVNDAVMYVKLTGLSAISALDKVRYVELLAHRLVQKVTFKIQNHELDSYTSDNYNAYYQFKLPIEKEKGYTREIGQEVPNLGYLTADPAVDEIREYRWFGDGPQTFKQIQPTVEMWIPILFWFKDLQSALPNFLLPMQQTEIEVKFASESEIIAYADYGGGGLYNVPYISNCLLYLNHIFLLPEIQKIFIAKYGFQLIRVHRNHTELLTENEKSVRLHSLKWPIECLYAAFRPQSNLLNSQMWHLNTVCTEVNVKEAVVTGVATIQVNNAIFISQKNVVTNLELKANDVVLYPSLPPSFYNDYVPYRYGSKLKTPKDLGWFMLNFNFYPGEQQPSGHFNCSRARELYLNYISALDPASGLPYIRGANPVELIVIAECINFLLCKDGAAVLRFST